MKKLLLLLVLAVALSASTPALANHDCTEDLSSDRGRLAQEDIDNAQRDRDTGLPNPHDCEATSTDSSSSGSSDSSGSSGTTRGGSSGSSSSSSGGSGAGTVTLQGPDSNIQALYAGNLPLSAQNPIDILLEIRNFLMITGIVVIVIMLIWAGLTYITSQGDPEKVAAAKQRFVWAVIGTALVLGTFIIIQTIRAILDQRSIFTSTTTPG